MRGRALSSEQMVSTTPVSRNARLTGFTYGLKGALEVAGEEKATKGLATVYARAYTKGNHAILTGSL